MKQIGLISTGVLLLLLGTAAPTYAQERHEQEAQSPKEEQQAKPEKQEQAKGQQKQEKEQQKQAKGQQKQEKEQQKQAKGQQKQEKEQQQQAKGQQKQEKEQQQQAKGQQKQEKEQGQQQARSSHGPQRTQQEEARQRAEPALRLSSRSEGRIPEDRFRSHFGREHRFRIGGPRMVDGYSRFQYGGFWFGFVDPWPEGWYYTDDVYIDFIDGGYYLYNPYYPGVRIAICVVT